MDDCKGVVAEILLRVKAVTLSPRKAYTYASGIRSPVYCDNRLLISYPKERRVIRDCFEREINKRGISFDVVAGTASAGIPHAAWLADKLGKPMVYVRSSKKEHGKEKQIEGVVHEGDEAVVIEDLVSTGGSSISAVNALREAGVKVDWCLSIFSYGLEEAKESFREAECTLISLSDFSTLIELALEKGYINKEEKEMLLEWQRNPRGWDTG